MEFELTYEIQRKDYALANAATFRASGRSRLPMWMLLASALLLLFLPITYREPDAGWSYPFIVVPFAAYQLYAVVLWLSPFLNGIISYKSAKLAGNKYVAHFSPAEVRISGEHLTWIHKWTSFPFIRELPELFVFCDGIIIYIFAKRYFSPEQIEGLRELIKSNSLTGRAKSTDQS